MTTPANRHRMSKVSDTYSFDEIYDLTEEDMDNLLLFFPANRVPSIFALHALRQNVDHSKVDLFDGSFGFHIGV